METALVEKVELAKQDKHVLNTLILEYTPFIKKSISQIVYKPEARRDALTCAMLAFVRAAQTYNSGHGAFASYAGTLIRNRLIDEARQEKKLRQRFFPFSAFAGGEAETPEWENDASRAVYDIEQERLSLSMEIDEVNNEFSSWGFGWNNLIKKCPKQERSRKTCFAIAKKILDEPELTASMMKTKGVPAAALAAHTGFSKKAMEKYRPYIVALVILLRGDYPYIRAFLPQFIDTDIAEEEAL
jgi:RNA polymerase sigma factor